MFQIQTDKHGRPCIITDNAVIAEEIAKEQAGRIGNDRVRVWYTGAPSPEVARAIATALNGEFPSAHFSLVENVRVGGPRWTVK